MTRALVLGTLLTTLACGAAPKAPDPLPAAMQRPWVRLNSRDFVALDVDAATIVQDGFTLRILEGEVLRDGVYRVAKASTHWEHTGVGDACAGLIRFDEDALELELRDYYSDEPCSGVSIAGRWLAARELDAVPPEYRGEWGHEHWAVMRQGRIDEASVAVLDEDKAFRFERIVEVAGHADVVFVDARSTVADYGCRGTLGISEDGVKIDLDGCLKEQWVRWSTKPELLPPAMASGGARYEREGDVVRTFGLDGALRCEQRIVRTAERDAEADARVPFSGGIVAHLADAEPTAGVDLCDRRLRTLSEPECQVLFDGPCDPRIVDQHYDPADSLCPRQLWVEPDAGRFVLDWALSHEVCFDPRGVLPAPDPMPAVRTRRPRKREKPLPTPPVPPVAPA